MTEPSEQQRREKRIERVLNYLKIDDYDDDGDDDDFEEFIYDELYGIDDYDYNGKGGIRNCARIYDICRLIVDKQQKIFLKTGILVPFDEIMKKAIIRGLYEYRI